MFFHLIIVKLFDLIEIILEVQVCGWVIFELGLVNFSRSIVWDNQDCNEVVDFCDDADCYEIFDYVAHVVRVADQVYVQEGTLDDNDEFDRGDQK